MGNKKNILIINPGPLFPIVMGSQDRVVEMIKRLSKDHSVYLATLVKCRNEIDDTENQLKGYIKSFFPIWAINNNFVSRVFMSIFYKLQYPIFALSKNYYYWSNPIVINKINRITSRNKFDIVQIEHWYQADLINKLNRGIIKVISSHDILFEKKELEFKQKYGGEIPKSRKKEIRKFKNQEIHSYNTADILITISNNDYKKIKVLVPLAKHITIPMGKEISPNQISYNPENRTILFYGSMGGQQNIVAFFRFWDRIFPTVRKYVHDVKLLIVGANPPRLIKQLHNGNEIIVTGYIKDLASVFQYATVMIIPLETGGGFRGRVIDVMSYGIPVIGSHNALDCIEIENDKQGFISDDDNELALRLVDILTNPKLANSMSLKCKKFVTEKYSIEATYGKLSKYYLEL